jgi:hypothetical protein
MPPPTKIKAPFAALRGVKEAQEARFETSNKINMKFLRIDFIRPFYFSAFYAAYLQFMLLRRAGAGGRWRPVVAACGGRLGQTVEAALRAALSPAAG